MHRWEIVYFKKTGVFEDILLTTLTVAQFLERKRFFLVNAPNVPVISVLPEVTSHSVTPISASFK